MEIFEASLPDIEKTIEPPSASEALTLKTAITPSGLKKSLSSLK
ncbi:hypothetical protein OAI32_03620 [Gammaproteobacteria bacterium]|nr:hypothetical protein [Gammaproteobacteria bacterium]MDB9901343.1 hypothetical protein [Gammaproteobacteria bacterium]MDC0123372.1 hypothetical protein [Gammaproteobacteria bacterium]MDC1277531.1 hypothetical protein [Gammaproteobacteria bacterium]